MLLWEGPVAKCAGRPPWAQQSTCMILESGCTLHTHMHRRGSFSFCRQPSAHVRSTCELIMAF